jgi:soluble lytic murein transglycosylase
VALRTRYWHARVGEQLAPGSEESRSAFEAIAREFPLSYYGWRSLERVGGLEEGAATVPEILPGTRAINAADLERPRILLGAGMQARAASELDRLHRQARGLADRLDLAQLYSDAGEYHNAQRIVVDAYSEALARGPVASLEELWWHAWPAAYTGLVERSTASREWVDADLVFSIMREESGYRAKVVSPNGAKGLLQIMDETGARLAQKVGLEEFEAESLFEPEINLDLGSYYLGELRQRFNGRLSAAIASYNAGPNAVSEWVREGADIEDDEWVEAIPYDQTRSYVKRVLRSIQVYRILY